MIEILLAVIGGIGTLALSYFREMKNDVKSMSESIVQLNLKLERVINDQTWHRQELNEIKQRLDALEK